MGPFHSGELEIQRRAGLADEAREVGRIIAPGLPPGVERFLARQRLAIASSLDAGGRVWASPLAGAAGFLQPVDDQLLRVDARPPAGDPLAADLAARPELGLLAFDPTRRQRVRFNGRGLLAPEGIFLAVAQAYGNCTKYIQRRHPLPDEPAGAAAPRVGAALGERQRAWIDAADTFFIASFHPAQGADVSHRGGLPGFVRATGPRRIVFPDYPGNAMFNTLGNLLEYPRAGLLFLDFTRGDVLQLAGEARVGSDFSVEFDVGEVRESAAALPLRYALLEYSPVNPPLSRPAAPGISSDVPHSTTRRHAR